MTNAEMRERDLAHIWHPCSQMKDYETLPFIPIKSGKGAYLFDFDGNRYLDAISSWWVNLFGHANPYINEKVKEQLDTLEHVIFAGFSHEPAIRLAERLVALTPEKLTRLFFADNGSSAIEIALKMSFQYYKNRGEVRDVFISLENSYHGETMGALAVGDVALYKEIYSEILIRTVQAKSPALVAEDEALASMEALFQKYEGRISAVVIEPLVQCAGSMAMYGPEYIRNLRELCDAYGIFLIADEIAVGFGRTGTMFACEQADIVPDFLCLSKGITGGYLPLSVVMTSDEVYSAFYCDYSEGKSFLDSHSYTGNALACMAANATLDIFENEHILDSNRVKIDILSALLQRFEDLPNVLEVRQRGFIAAVELKGYDPSERIGLQIYRYALSHGVLLRPLGHVVYFMPPYVVTEEELVKMTDVAYEAIKSLL
ncbi:MAG TPA: adenosylmethionine--8-amino-7-oxononanoate transaminase [Campylobacteraceae bacterium]|nr:adenosylmethionine--8-amino-7-oxononanoate transaminase [Campylobacteraceae bacterium]HHD83905.1 adenosylmethionine--8-amino-7-oxononanoate transaminase [Campylobacteraceae bacterium]